VKIVKSGDTLAVSGFTKSGEPKTFLPALAKHFAATNPDAKVNLFSGASLSNEVEDPLAPFIKSRGPYMSSGASRKLIHAGKMDFMDVHLSLFARNLMYGFYGDIHTAVIEVSRIRPDGSVVLTNSVGISTEALLKAKKIILEINTICPDYTGFHDIVAPSVHPSIHWPIPITNVIDRVGKPYVEFDISKVVAIVESTQPDYPVPFKGTSDVDKKIAQNVIEYLLLLREQFHWAKRLPPIQSGVGNIANAVVDFSALGSLANGEYIFATYQFLQGTEFFDELNLPGTLTLHHNTTNKYFSLIGSYSATLPGDFNNDNKVDAADYVVWRKNPSGFPPNAYDTWRASFGNPVGSGASVESSAVPEPTVGACVLLGAALLASIRGVNRRSQRTRRAS
jgi:hypothetical protein